IKGDKENELFEKEEQQCIREILGSIDTFSEGTKDEIMNITLIEKWDKISSETDTCLKVKCEFFSKCFFFKARKEVNQSHLIVVNHHLLCSDIALKGEIGDVSSSYGLLPPYQKVIIDEAHNFEHVAINYFGYSVSWFGFKQTVSRLYHLKGSHEKGVLAFIKREITRWKEDKSYEIIDDIYNLLTEHIITDVLSLNPFIDDFFQMMTNYTEKTLKLTPFETKLRLIPDKLPDSIKHIIKIESSTLIQSISALYERLSQLHSKLEEIPFHLKEEILGNIKNLEAYNNRLLSALTNLETFVHFKESDAVYWIDYKKRNNAPSISLNVSPLNISDLLSEVFFITKETIILTSATLTTNNNFQFIKKELGLAQTPSNNITEAILPSPFNYKEQMSICIPTENPDPQDSDFSDRVNELLIDILEITLGNTFILFTSYGMLNHTYEHLKTHFDHRINLLKQGSASRHDLLNRFKNGNNSVLLGTDSFWEGVDVPGDALRCVILVKLPFKVPTEPITQGKIEKLEREGKNSFIEYSVPQSVIKFKQGFGRLIRTQEDRGVVICLDKRIITKSYGKIFLNSLPNCHQIIGNNSVILEKMSKYF
ncbi:MAG: hypothetical protein OEV44_07345, partial [Spirochaetota bacterium]|nr:hypothetical protein [Spirochaetota bacterium]